MSDKDVSRRVVILDTGYESYDVESEILVRESVVLDAFAGARHDMAGRLAFARDAVGVMIRWSEFDSTAFNALPALRYLVRYGVGYDNVDVAAASARGVVVCNVQGYASHSVSDHALSLILASVRNLREGMALLWESFGKPPRVQMPDLKDLTLGIVGLGRIGGTLSTKCRGLFRRIIACDPYVPSARFQECGAEQVDFPGLLAQADVVSIHCNLTDETRGLFDGTALCHMRPGAILVNTARGPVVDEDALLESLEAEHLYAAGIDVFCDEPPRENRRALLAHPHVVATGHYAWHSSDAGQELQRRAAENMAAMLRGEIPDDCLNPEVAQKSSG